MAYEKSYYNLKEQQERLQQLLDELNQLSCKEYNYVYHGGESYQIWWKHRGSNIRTQFRYATRVEDLIKTVEILIRYRMIEYESEYDYDNKV